MKTTFTKIIFTIGVTLILFSDVIKSETLQQKISNLITNELNSNNLNNTLKKNISKALKDFFKINQDEEKPKLSIELGTQITHELIEKELPSIYNFIKKSLENSEPFIIEKTIGPLFFSLEISKLDLKDFIYNKNDLKISHSLNKKNNNLILKFELANKDIDITGKYTTKQNFLNDKRGDFELNFSCKFELEIELVKTSDSHLNFKVKSLGINHKIINITIENHNIYAFLLKETNIIKSIIDFFVSREIKNSINNYINVNFNNKNLTNDLKMSVLKNQSFGVLMQNDPSFTEEDFLLCIGLVLKQVNDNNNDNSEEKVIKLINIDDIILNKNQNNLHSLLEPQAPLTTNSFSLTINDKILNLLSNAAFNSNILNFEISNKIFPKDFPIKLNTYFFQDLVPEMYKKYPDSDLKINIKFQDSPNIVISEQNKDIQLKGEVLIEFLLENSVEVIFSMKSTLEFSVKILQNPEFYKFFFNLEKLDIENTEVVVPCGETTGKQIDDVIDMLLDNIVFIVNQNLLNKGVLLPSVLGYDINKNVLEIKGKDLFLMVEPVEKNDN